MKQWLPLLAVVLAVVLSAVSQASAGGINLAWNNCLPTAGSAQDLGSLCDIASNGNVYLLYGSVITGVAIPDFASQTDVLDLQVANASLDDWWKLASGECR